MYTGRVDVAEYLARIGADAGADLATLVDRHYHAVPFENLSIHLGEPVDTRPAALFDKIVRRRRGGFCYELNGLFAWLLTELGYDVGFLGARVHAGETDTAPLAHQALRATGADGVARLVDVGFGGFSVSAAVLGTPSTQVDPQPDGDTEVRSPTGAPGYRLDGREYAREDFGPTCWWTATHPASAFTRGPTCSLPLSPAGRVTLADRLLIRTAADGTRTEDELPDDEALAAYRDLFGVVLDRLPVPLHPDPPGEEAPGIRPGGPRRGSG